MKFWKKPFFSWAALPILLATVFLLPFAGRGVRYAMQNMQNNIKDWLPADFPETAELDWFREHFLGEQFVIITWPGCHEGDPSYQILMDELAAEIASAKWPPAPGVYGPAAAAAHARANADQRPPEHVRARLVGNHFGIHSTGNLYVNWGGKQEKWLKGNGDDWFYVLPTGELYAWEHKPNMTGMMWMALHHWRDPASVLKGRYVTRFVDDGLDPRDKAVGHASAPGGQPLADAKAPAAASVNPYYADPLKLTECYFSTLSSGPKALEKLAAREGPLWPRGSEYAGLTDEEKQTIARQKALDRLKGVLYDDSGRLTCVMVTLSENGKKNMGRVVGRPVLGRPEGRLRTLAFAECGIAEDALKMGGPPIDNVAIDEEGTLTLVSLIGLSAVVGLSLAYGCFRDVKLTLMVMFVGGASAIGSLAAVWWTGSAVDAVMMSMPSLVYVMGLSGATHIVNNYYHAVREHGVEGAPDRALSHCWFPCLLCAFTTSLGMGSLCTSNLLPIWKFGFYTAIGTMGTVVFIFTFMPAALTVFPPNTKKILSTRDEDNWLRRWSLKFWDRFGAGVIRWHAPLAIGMCVGMTLVGIGAFRLNTSVHLLKLFDSDAKVVRDYSWLDSELFRLVPMELVVRVDKSMLYNTRDHSHAVHPASPATAGVAQTPAGAGVAPGPSAASGNDQVFQYEFLERMEIAQRLARVVEAEFGPRGQDIAGKSLSAATFAPDLFDARADRRARYVLNDKLEAARDDFLRSDFLRDDHRDQAELWRVSARLGALADVDYGDFVHELKKVVEPVMEAHHAADRLLRQVAARRPGGDYQRARVLVIGADPRAYAAPTPDAAPRGEGAPEARTVALASAPANHADADGVDARRPGGEAHLIDQTRIFTQTLDDILQSRGFRRRADSTKARVEWYDPASAAKTLSAGELAELARDFDGVVLARDVPACKHPVLAHYAPVLVDARGHQFDSRRPGALTMEERRKQGEDIRVSTVYTGIVPIVYKAQRTLLVSLIESVILSFVMISGVMMILLRDWRSRWRPSNTLNITGGLLSMIPNLFPLFVVFGVMGWLGVVVDIGTMMCASIALGIAVDDTIHFLNVYREGLDLGLPRREAVRHAYAKCATAMTQTTLIGGLGMSVFAFSTFTPTQYFGTMMLCLLGVALVGDLVLTPALLAGPLGAFFGKPRQIEGQPTREPPGDEGGHGGDDGSTGPAASARPGAERPADTAEDGVAKATPADLAHKHANQTRLAPPAPHAQTAAKRRGKAQRKGK